MQSSGLGHGESTTLGRKGNSIGGGGGRGSSSSSSGEEVLPELNHDEVRRYSRHLILPEVGVKGQRRLKGSSILAVGTGGLGSPALLYLAAAGVGRIGIVDDDVVDESNLQRQVSQPCTMSVLVERLCRSARS